MNWKGKLVALLMWTAFIGALGFTAYTTVYDSIENQTFTAQFATDLNQASRGKMLVLDARIHSRGVFEVWYTNKNGDTIGTGMTELEAANVNKVQLDAIEWTMINRDVTIFKWSWVRNDRQGNPYISYQAACIATHILENNPRPECSTSESWRPLPAKNNRYRT